MDAVVNGVGALEIENEVVESKDLFVDTPFCTDPDCNETSFDLLPFPHNQHVSPRLSCDPIVWAEDELLSLSYLLFPYTTKKEDFSLTHYSNDGDFHRYTLEITVPNPDFNPILAASPTAMIVIAGSLLHPKQRAIRSFMRKLVLDENVQTAQNFRMLHIDLLNHPSERLEAVKMCTAQLLKEMPWDRKDRRRYLRMAVARMKKEDREGHRDALMELRLLNVPRTLLWSVDQMVDQTITMTAEEKAKMEVELEMDIELTDCVQDRLVAIGKRYWDEVDD